VVKLPKRRRRERPRPIVLLCDVSGSMERYSRTLLHFAHTLSKKARRVEAFVFATRLTRITMDLRTSRADAAIAAAARSVQDWSGGTRIGAALRAFHQRWARRSLNSAAVVLLISDGWDRGEPAVLRDQIARLQRGCHRLIWLNPLIGTIDYAPLTQGLQAALPFVDDFVEGHSLAALERLARVVVGGRGPEGIVGGRGPEGIVGGRGPEGIVGAPRPEGIVDERRPRGTVGGALRKEVGIGA
jgi:uncharacterized protein with von Willebrand factor type A (vWA) domain